MNIRLSLHPNSGVGAKLGVDGDQDPEREGDERGPRAGDPLRLPLDLPQRLHALLAPAAHHSQEAPQVSSRSLTNLVRSL